MAIDYSRLNKTPFCHPRMSGVSAAVVGLGALGNEVVRFLSMIGAGKLILIDDDCVEESNLPRSLFYCDVYCIGQNKAQLIATKLAVNFGSLHTVPLPYELADVGWQHLKDIQIVFSCVDSASSRLQTAWLSTEMGIPVCDGGLGSPSSGHGRVTWFPGRRAACFSCLLTSERRARLLTGAQSATRSCLKGSEEDPEAGRSSTPTLASIVAALQVETAMRCLDAGVGESFSTTVSLTPSPLMDRTTHSISRLCPWHGPQLRRASSAGLDCPAAVLDRLPPEASLVLDYPICTGARCTTCAYCWQPMQRLQKFARSGMCPLCGGPAEPVETLTHIGPGTRWAAMSFSDLGLPEHHYFAVSEAVR